MAVHIQFRPLTQWPVGRVGGGVRSKFKCGYDRAFRTLRDELGRIGVSHAVLMVDLNESDIRADGLPRGDRRPRSNRTAVSFARGGRDYIMRCNQYDDWIHNLYAIAKTLEALRAVDRWGVTNAGEQYTGFTALPAGEFASPELAAAYIVTVAGGSTAEILASADELNQAYRRGAKVAHPDKVFGSEEQFTKLQRAVALIRSAKGWTR